MKNASQDILDVSYAALAILDLCAVANEYLEDQVDAGFSKNLHGSISLTIRHTIGLLGQVHDVLEKSQLSEVKA